MVDLSKLKLNKHECSLDIEAYECPICWRHDQDEEVIDDGKDKRKGDRKEDTV